MGSTLRVVPLGFGVVQEPFSGMQGHHGLHWVMLRYPSKAQDLRGTTMDVGARGAEVQRTRYLLQVEVGLKYLIL